MTEIAISSVAHRLFRDRTVSEVPTARQSQTCAHDRPSFARELAAKLLSADFWLLQRCGTLLLPVVPPDANELLHRPLTFATHVLPALAYASAVFYGGLIRIGALPQVGFVATDKLLHALAFGGLALLLARAAQWARPGATLGKKLVLGCVGSSLLGLLLEVCQAFTAYRSADALDWLADTVGALMAIGLTFMLFAWIPPRAHG